MKTKKQKVIKNKTRKISLKNDFYSYINRKWLNTIKIKNDDVKVDEYTILEDKVKESIYKNIILKNKNKNSIYLKESLTKYHNKKVEEKLLKLLEHLKFYLENENNLYKFLKFCFEENINVPFEFNIEVDKEDPTKFITVIDEEDLSFVNKDYYLLKSEYFIKAREHYKKYLHELLKNSLEPLNESYDINNIIEIEKKIAKIKLDIELTRYTSNIFNKLKTNKLKKLGFDWKEFSENMKLNKNIEYVNVSNIDYLKKIMKYLKNWNNEPWISYWKYNIVKSVLIYHKDWSKIDFNFFRNKLIGQKKAISMKQVFIDKYFIYYNTYISKEYIKNFEFKGNLKMVNELFYKIRNV
jgi:predicted metalloendopeptidase